MKIKTTCLITMTSILLFSCGKENNEVTPQMTTEIETDGNYFSNKWSAIKEQFTDSDSIVSKTITSGKEIVNDSKETVKKVEGNYISTKWKSTKGMFVDSDSVINARKITYFDYQKNNYPEYQSVQKWFESNPKELLNLKGDYYKMLKATITDGPSISYKDLIGLTEAQTYEYLFVTDDAYYIYDLSCKKNVVEVKGSRRIQKGYGKEPMHDLIFDSKMNLVKEVFQGEVTQDLFTKNGHLYFKFEKEVNDSFVKNTIDLGTERNF
jgi:hypothetical protein